jgi:Glutathione S-transferase N-terminal domain
MKAPRGQIPYVDLDGTIIPDSELVYNTCIEKGLVKCLDRTAGLNEKETAISRSLRSLIERDLLDILLYER